MAARLGEVAVADHHFSQSELEHLLILLEQKFTLLPDERRALAELARAKSTDATSLYQFTQLINRTCSPTEKFELVTAMWEIAYVDGQLDKYEEHVIRRVADLIHLAHSDFIRAKSLTRARQRH